MVEDIIFKKKNPSELIDHPLNKELFDDLSIEEYNQLKEDIKERGIQDPLQITTNSVVISGHQRRKIAAELGIDCPCIIRSDLKEDWQVEEQLISDNLLRRHLTDYQKVECGVRLEDIFHKKGELNKIEAGKRYGKGLPTKEEQLNLNSDKAIKKVDTLKEVSDKVGLKRDKYSKARKVYNEAPEPIKKEWKEGKKSTHAAYEALKKLEKEKQIKEEIQKQQEELKANPIPVGEGKYKVIEADCPWMLDCKEKKSAEYQYPLMSTEDIKNMRKTIDKLADEDCHLYLWAINPMLPEAIEVMKAWGFEYKTCLTWVKTSFGTGHYFRGATEHVLFGVRGKLNTITKNQPTHFQADKQKHSEKPDIFYEIVEKSSPYRKIRLFARKQRDGWDSWGNEILQ